MTSLSPFLFATGIENGYPTIAGGTRIDQMDRCGHYARWEEDFALVRESGLDALRYGPPYYRVHTAPDHYDWDICDAQMHRLRSLGISVIADLCHFGVPTWLGGFQDEAFPVLFAAYAGAFARRYPWVRHFSPVHEILTCASHSALHGWWNECEASEGSFLRAVRNLCMAHELAVEAILVERPDAIIVQAESGMPASLFDEDGFAAGANGLGFLALDLTTGHELAPGLAGLLNEHGVSSNDLSFFRERRAVGQRWLGGDEASWYHRYGMPLFHCGSSGVSEEAENGLEGEWASLVALRSAGAKVKGFAWHSLTDQLDWRHAFGEQDIPLHQVGMYDLRRRIRPVGRRYQEIVRTWRAQMSGEAPSSAATA